MIKIKNLVLPDQKIYRLRNKMVAIFANNLVYTFQKNRSDGKHYIKLTDNQLITLNENGIFPELVEH